MEQAVAGLKEEEAALTVEVVGRDAEDSQAFSLPQELLFPRVDPVVGRGLGTWGQGRISSWAPWAFVGGI